MWACYVVAVVPVVLGALAWIGSRRITLGEWVKGSVAGFVIVAAFHVWVVLTSSLDFEMRSGLAVEVTRWPEGFVEDGDESRFVEEHWTVTIDLGGDRESFAILQSEHDALAVLFGGEPTVERPRDVVPTDEAYRVEVVRNVRGVVVPGHTYRMVESGVGTASDVLAFAPPPDDLPLHEYPIGFRDGGLEPFLAVDVARSTSAGTIPISLQSFDWRRSRRLLGRAEGDFSIDSWDALNGEVGRAVGANLVAIGFDGDSSLAHWQEAKWHGGKTNDLVLCYGPPKGDGRPSWTYCFGWSDDELVLRNLETILLRSGPGDAAIPAIRDEVVARYRPRTWPPLDVMQVRPPAGSVRALLVVLLMLQGLYWVLAYVNRSRRAAADDVERAEAAEEERRRRERDRERAEHRRARELLPDGVGVDDVDALTRLVIEDEHPYGACLALTRIDGPRAIAPLVIATTSARFRACERAARWLDVHVDVPTASPEAAAAVPALLRRLRTPDPRSRIEVRRVLELIDPDWPARPDAAAETDALLQALDEERPGPGLRGALAARGAAAAGPLLERIARTDPSGRAPLLEALGETGDLRGLDVLLDGLGSGDLERRRGAASGLARFGPGLRSAADVDRVFEALVATLDGEDAVAADAAGLGLGWLGDERGVDRLAPRLRHPSHVRPAIEALGHLGSPRAIGPLHGRIDEVEHRDVVEIVRALGRIGDPLVERPLIELFAERLGGGSLVLEHVLHALFPLGGPAVEALFERTADDPHSGVSELAELRLRQLRGGFASPGWDRTAFAFRTTPAR